jgi:hypothetical protein
MACGSITHFQQLGGTITPTGHLFRRARSPGKAKYDVQHEEGHSFFRQTERWHHLTRVIDRVRGRYYEHITDVETGELVRHRDEPLSEHRQDVRGSATGHENPE